MTVKQEDTGIPHQRHVENARRTRTVDQTQQSVPSVPRIVSQTEGQLNVTADQDFSSQQVTQLKSTRAIHRVRKSYTQYRSLEMLYNDDARADVDS